LIAVPTRRGAPVENFRSMTSPSRGETSDHPSLTVGGALRLSPLERGVPEILAGAAGLDNPIRWVHSGEALQIASLLRGGELLMMTGMGLPDSEGAQRRFIASLADRRIAGVVIELGTALSKVPVAMVSEAEARALPLIALHREIPFVEVTEALHREIVNDQALALERGEEAHRRFTDLVLEGAGVPEVLAALSELIRNPVVLEKTDEGVLYHQAYNEPETVLHAAWDATVRRLSEAPVHVSVPVYIGRRRTWGTLHALATSSPLHHGDRVVIERGASLIALVLLSRNQEHVLQARERGNFIEAIMTTDAHFDESEASLLAADFGFARRHLLRLPLVAVRTYDAGIDQNGSAEQSWAPVWREITHELAGMRMPALAGILPHEPGLGLIVALPSAEARHDVAERVSATMRRAAERHLGRMAVTVCVGGACRTWSELGVSLREAVEVGHALSRGAPRPWHDATTPSINRLFWALRDEPALPMFVHQQLEAIIRHDRAHQTQLVATLAAYCRHGGRIADAARTLHLQRQSVYKRIIRIEELLGTDIGDAEVRLGLHVALLARSYLQDHGDDGAYDER